MDETTVERLAPPAAPVGARAELPPARSRRVTPNLFAVSFGLAGLAQAWTLAASTTSSPPAVADALWAVVGLVWLGVLALYVRDLVRGGRWRTELADATFAPFVSLAVIVPMLLGVALSGHAYAAGVSLFGVAFAGTLVLGGWLSGQWIVADLTLDDWHPGFFLPTVAGGYLASECWATLGHDGMARLMFGYASVCWSVLGSVVLLRLFTRPLLRTPLLPTMAIELAPPAVGGAAWFAIDGGRADTVAHALAGYALLMGLVQLRLVGVYRRVPFGLAWWAFAFSYAAAFVDGLWWIRVEHVAHAAAWTFLLLTLLTAAIGTLVVRTLVAVRRGTFLPPPAPLPTPALLPTPVTSPPAPAQTQQPMPRGARP